MKKYYALYFFLSICLFSYAQNQDLDFIDRLQGIKQKDFDFFELEGYQIFVKSTNQPFDKQGIKTIKKELKIKKSLPGYKSTQFASNNLVIHEEKIEHEKLTTHQSWYLIEKTQNQTICFGFGSENKRDTTLEHKFVNAYLGNKIPQSIYSSMQVDSIDFAGRKIALGESCHWMGVRNVQCPYYGQMNWSLHRTYQDAENSTNSQYFSTERKKMGSVLESNEVDIVFEGADTKAKRVVYKFKLPRALMGGSNILIIYYVTAKLRDNYISCVLSHYTNDPTNKALPPLLEKVMKVK